MAFRSSPLAARNGFRLLGNHFPIFNAQPFAGLLVHANGVFLIIEDIGHVITFSATLVFHHRVTTLFRGGVGVFFLHPFLDLVTGDATGNGTTGGGGIFTTAAAELMAYHAADRQPIAPEALRDDAILHLHPGLRMLRLSHPAFSIWQANQPGADGRVKASGAQIALVWRRPDLSVGIAWAHECGAVSMAFQPQDDDVHVLADPAGHPFCLFPWARLAPDGAGDDAT